MSSKSDVLAAMTRTARRLPQSLTREDGVMSLLMIYYDWFAAHPKQIAMTEVVAAWDAGRTEGA